jgi:hypothetical protein
MLTATSSKDLELIKRRYVKARAKADLWIALLEACYHYTVPNRNLFYWTSQYQGAQKNARVWDTTAVAGVRNFVSKIQGGLCPPQQCWFLLEAGTDIPEEYREEVNIKLQEITNTVYHYLRRSNFDLAINECFYDLAIGTGCLICNDSGSDDMPLEFFSVPLARVAIEETITNTLETNFRWWDEIRIEDIKEMWPQAVLGPVVQSLYDEDNNATIKNLVEGTIYHPYMKDTPYRYVVFFENEFFVDEWMDSSPWVVFRWSKVNNEVYGRGPVIDALPSILSLNELARVEMASANFNISKPYMAYSDGIFNPWTFKLEPNTVIPVSPSGNGQWPIQPFPDTANPQFMQLTSNDLRMQINKLLYADPLGPVTSPQQTATEIALRQRNMAEEIGPPFTRLQPELLTRVLKRVMYILEKHGLISKLRINGKEVQITYKSPLVVAQGQQDVQNFMQWYQVLQAVQGPEAALINLNPVKFPHWSSNKLGVDPTLLNSEEQMQEFLSSQSEKAQEQELMMMEGAQGGIQAQPNIGTAQ